MKKSVKFFGLLFSAVAFLGCGLSAQPRVDASPAKPVATPPRTPDAKLFARNLLANPNAESGNSDGWANAGELKTISYGEWGGGPTKEAAGPTNRGEKYFYARVDGKNPSIGFKQKFDLDGAAASIDAGQVECSFGGWFGGINTSFTSARLRVEFFGADGKPLGSDQTEDVKPDDRADDYTLIERRRSIAVPNGTRRLEATLEFYILKDKIDPEFEADAFADELWLNLVKKETAK